MRNSAFLALAAIGAVVGANAHAQGPVYSVNIVGFQKVTSSNEYTQASAPFVKSDASINSVIGVQGDAGSTPSTADQILIWNGSAYRSIFLSNITNPPELNNKWVEFDENSGELAVSTATLPVGTGFWIQNNGAANTFTIVGDVEMAATKSVTINPGYNMVSYPYSTTAAFNTVQMNLNAASGVLGNAGGSLDKIYIWNGSAYIELIYYEGGDPNFSGKWAYFDENSGELAVADQVIQPGQGFWYLRSGATPFNWTTTKPY